MERTASKREASSLTVGVVGLLRKCQATKRATTTLPIRSSPPNSHLSDSMGSTAFLEKGEPCRERSPQHSVCTKGLGPCASQPGGPFSLKTAIYSSGQLFLSSAPCFWLMCHR